MVSDHEVLTAMLDRAGIDWQAPGDTVAYEDAGIPTGATSVWIGGTPSGSLPQRYAAGYGRYFTEFVFSAEGALLAVWAWE